MIKYHNTEKGPRLCTAEIRECKYAAEGGNHYTSQEEAQVDYEEKMSSAFGLVPTLSKVGNMCQKAYRGLEASARFVNRVQDPGKDAYVKSMSAIHNARQIDYKATVKATFQKNARKMSESMLKIVSRASHAAARKADEILEIKYKSTDFRNDSVFVASSNGEIDYVAPSTVIDSPKIKKIKERRKGLFASKPRKERISTADILAARKAEQEAAAARGKARREREERMAKIARTTKNPSYEELVNTYRNTVADRAARSTVTRPGPAGTPVLNIKDFQRPIIDLVDLQRN